jgi:hypothetical protein
LANKKIYALLTVVVDSSVFLMECTHIFTTMMD